MPYCEAESPQDKEGVKVRNSTDRAPEKIAGVISARDSNIKQRVASPPMEEKTMVRKLECEFEQMTLRLRDTIDRNQAKSEKLKAENEKLRLMNHELILEIGELRAKMEKLGQVNSDLHNLMNATAVATVFLDRQLRIMRYTPSAVPLFHLIPNEIGRPLADLRSRIEYPELIQDAEQVLQTLVPVEREVCDSAACWFMVRLLPYRRAEDDQIDGVVLTFVDVTARRRAVTDLRARNEELERFNNAAVDREIRMIELKKEVNAALERCGEAARYKLELGSEEIDHG